MAEEKKQLENKEPNYSAKFMAVVMAEFKEGGSVELSKKEKELIRRYFIGIDYSLKIADEKRIQKNKTNTDTKWNNDLPLTWTNIDIQDLAPRVVDNAKLGLDMALKNHVSPVPYKNKTTGKYNITMMRGYVGMQVVAEKYALEKPVNVITELVRATDKFTIIKKDMKNKVEGYSFEITNPFSRGEVTGGFGYIMYKNPERNKLITMSLADILKRKPLYASPEFWGGEKQVWEDGKKVYENNKPVMEKVEGWKEEMYLKTLRREVFSEKNIILDPAKVDVTYQNLQMRETQDAELAAETEAAENANKEVIDIAADQVKEQPATGAETGKPQEPVKSETTKEDKTKTGPGY